MDYSRKIESVFIASLIVLSLATGIVCSLYEMNTVISSICFAIGITSLVYWFLGGISAASFNMGYLKLGGSIAALLGSFYLINDQMKSSAIKCQGIEIIDSPVLAIDMNTGNAAQQFITHNDDTLALLNATFSKTKFRHNNLVISDGLEVVNENGFVLGKLDKKMLREKQFFNAIRNSNHPGELFKFNLLETKKNTDLDISIKAKSFRADGIAEFELKSLTHIEKSVQLFIRNKGMQVIQLGSKFYLISATQADFSAAKKKEDFYVHLFIKPLIAE